MTDLALFGSPKRKRDLQDNLGRAASPLRVKMDLDQRGSEGPECHISNEFQELHIQAQEPIPQRRDFRGGANAPSGPLAFVRPPTFSEDDMKPSPSTAMPTPLSTQNSSSQPSHTHNHHNLLAPPRTPPLQPISLSPYDTPRTISPLPSLSDLRDAACMDAATTAESESRLVTPPLSSPSTDTTPTAQRTRTRSPPPTALTSDLVWTADEITGHNPDPNDPNDDGYGINGIGFRPTSAVAQQRTLRRRQQVADWKSREAREARNRRAERRKSSGFGRVLEREERRHVRFVEG